MTHTQHPRPWYCIDALVDDYRSVYRQGGDLMLLRTLKLLRSIIVNIGLISIILVALFETSADPTLVIILGVPTLAFYNGLEVSDYVALAQAISEVRSDQANQNDGE